MRLIGEGMTAKIYEYSPISVAKVFHADFPWEYAEYEKNLLMVVSDLAVKTAKYIDFQTIERQPAIIMDKVSGPSLFELVMRNPLKSPVFLKRFVDAQREIHAKTTERLPKEKKRFTDQLLRSGLEATVLEKLSALIDTFPEIHSVCHGDYHFGNVIVSRGVLYAVDWMNSYSGNPLGDIFRSYLMLKSPYNPLPIRGLRKQIFMTHKNILAEIYLRLALRNRKLRENEKRIWLAIIAAVRLSDRVPDEREWLIGIIEKVL